MHDPVAYLYRVFCQPTALAAETRELSFWQRVRVMVRLTPLMFAASLLTAVMVAVPAQALGLQSNWVAVAATRMAESLVLGLVFGAAWSVVMGVALGVVWGPLRLVSEALVAPMMPGLAEGVGAAMVLWTPAAIAFGAALGVTMRTARGAAWGVAAALWVSLLWPAGWRLAGGGGFLLAFLVWYFQVEWYAIDAGSMLWQLSMARRDPSQARQMLRWSAIHWREPIWLPLIGLKSFLRLVDRQDPQGALEECLFVILERPTQASAARAMLVEISTTHLARLDSVEAIAAAAEPMRQAQERAGQLVGNRVALPDYVERATAAVNELTQLAEQHVTATLPHNRRRAVERLRDGAEALQRELAVAGGRFASMWVAVARKWRDVAEARLAEMTDAGKSGGFVYNPFVFGQPIEETETNLFVGRRDVVREIERSLLGAAQKPTLVLWGPRRMGKTSVLKQLPRLLGPEFAPAFLDMQGMQARESVSGFFSSLTTAAAGGLRRRGVEAEELGASELKESPFGAFADWLKRVEEQLGEGRYLLLCLDEFERLERSIQEGKLPVELMDQIRHIIQHHSRVVLLFAGSHRPDEMALNWADSLISTRLVQVSYLREDEARQLVTQPVPDFGLTYGPGSVERIVEVTRCQPYLVQAVCFELVNHVNAEGRAEAREDDVTAAVGYALESTRLYFVEMWRQLSESQQGVLRGVAGASEGAASAELATATGRTAEEVEADLRTLEARSIVEGPGGRWRVQVPIIGQWVRTHAP